MDTSKSIATVQKVVAKLETVGSTLLDQVNTLVVKDQPSLETAVDYLARVKEVSSQLREKKAGILDPLSEAVKAVRSLFSGGEKSLADAEAIIKGKIGGYERAKREAEEREMERLARAVEAGKMKPETAVKKAEMVVSAPKRVDTGSGSKVTFRTNRIVEWDENTLPRAYLIPDAIRIRREALAGVKIPGVTIREEKVVVAG